MSDWKIFTANLRLHNRYKALYANSLRDALKVKNGKGRGKKERVEYMAELEAEDWVEVVLTEMAADEWFIEPVAMQRGEVPRPSGGDTAFAQAVGSHSEVESPLVERELVAVPKVSSNGNGNGHY